MCVVAYLNVYMCVRVCGCTCEGVYMCGLYMCVRTCIVMHVCVYVSYAYVHGCTSECVHMCMVAYLSAYMCVHAHVSVCACVCGYGGQRTTLPVTPQELSTLSFGAEPLTGLS